MRHLTEYRKRRRGFTLTEVLIATVILAMCSVPVIGSFIMSKRGIVSSDYRREVRFHMQHILSKVNRTSLHFLFDNFGPPEVGNIPNRGTPGKFRDRIAEWDPVTGQLASGEPIDVNPLGFTENYLRDLAGDGFDARLLFEFYTKRDLQIGPNGEASDEFGILHMQAGYVDLVLVDRKEGSETRWRQPIMCPAIVGRPGLKLSSCPAIAVDVKADYEPALDSYEAAQGI